jgi:mRNA interferase RelE/StbE
LAFEIEFDPDAVKDLRNLDRQAQQRLIGFLKLRVATLANLPRRHGYCSGAEVCEGTNGLAMPDRSG